MPRLSAMCLISNCICSRSCLSSAPSGSSISTSSGFEDQRAGQGDALLLAAGQLRRPPPPKAPICTMSSARLTFFSRSPCRSCAPQAGSEVLGHRHVREQGVVLEHHADAALVRRDVVDFRPSSRIAPWVAVSNPPASSGRWSCRSPRARASSGIRPWRWKG
jgi:hypothetical protein